MGDGTEPTTHNLWLTVRQSHDLKDFNDFNGFYDLNDFNGLTIDRLLCTF
jgi:hypothetical protein